MRLSPAPSPSPPASCSGPSAMLIGCYEAAPKCEKMNAHVQHPPTVKFIRVVLDTVRPGPGRNMLQTLPISLYEHSQYCTYYSHWFSPKFSHIHALLCEQCRHTVVVSQASRKLRLACEATNVETQVMFWHSLPMMKPKEVLRRENTYSAVFIVLRHVDVMSEWTRGCTNLVPAPQSNRPADGT